MLFSDCIIRKSSHIIPFKIEIRYGVESWRFYFSNLFVNFNLSLAFVCVALSLGLKKVFSNRVGIVSFASALIWFSAMQSRPHKEERFLFVIYPCICVLSSYVCVCVCVCVCLHAYIEMIVTNKTQQIRYAIRSQVRVKNLDVCNHLNLIIALDSYDFRIRSTISRLRLHSQIEFVKTTLLRQCRVVSLSVLLLFTLQRASQVLTIRKCGPASKTLSRERNTRYECCRSVFQ